MYTNPIPITYASNKSCCGCEGCVGCLTMLIVVAIGLYILSIIF